MAQDFKKWKYYVFEVRHKGRKRQVDVFAPTPAEAAVFATGKSDDEDVVVKRIDAADERFRALFARKKPKAQELADFYEGMASAYEVNADFKLALSLVAPNAQTPVFRGVIAGLYNDRQKVENMAEVFARFPVAFDKVAVTVIQQGFETGKVKEAFVQLAAEAADSQDLMSEVYAGLWYPAFLILAVSAALFFFNILVFPKVTATFAALNFKLPQVTRILVFFVQKVFMNPLLSVGPPVVIATALFYRKELMARPFFQRLVLRVPLVGTFYRKIILARSLKTLSVFYGNGVPQKRGYEIAAEMAGNITLAGYFRAISGHLSKGVPLYTAFHLERERAGDDGLNIANKMKVAGGAADEHAVLERIARNYKADVQRFAKVLPRMVEPVMIVGIGAVVALMFIGIFLPNLQYALETMKDANRFAGVQASEAQQVNK